MRETLGATAVAWALGLMATLSIDACTVKEDCNDCNVTLQVPVPDCVVYQGSQIRLCPDAGDEAAVGDSSE